MRKGGLEGVVVADSSITFLDGQAGVLAYRGYRIEELVEKCRFEEVAHLLWYGGLPTTSALRETRNQLAAHRPLAVGLRDLIGHFPSTAPIMSVLRTAVSAIGLFDPRAESPVHETNVEMAIELTSQMASIVAVFYRQRQGLEEIWPDPGRSHAGNFLFMLTGKPPDELSERIFDQCLTLHADHEFNASTFTGRVVASTLSDIYSSIAAAIGALRGPLHGGANTRVMHMLEEIGTPDRAEAYVKDLLARKERVMGIGHRVYKTEDPRAAVLRRRCHELGVQTGQEHWADICAVIEEVMLREKGLHCNVDFYSAPVYNMLGLSTDLYTPIFALARVVGWTAHILEQYSHNRLIRPLSQYVGPEERTVPPIEERG